MTTSEIGKIRKVLEMRVNELTGATRRRDFIAIENTADGFDRRLQAIDREIAVRHLEAESIRLRETHEALQRLDDGTYGICTECEEPVGRARLAALPWAALCIHCQQAADSRCAAHSARPMLAMAA